MIFKYFIKRTMKLNEVKVWHIHATYKTTVIPIFVTDCTFVHPFDFMIGRNQGTKVIDYEELLINPENTIQDLVKQIQELVGSSSKKVKINNVDLFYDSTKLKKDVSSLIDALISIEVKYGLYCRKMGKYNIEFEVYYKDFDESDTL